MIIQTIKLGWKIIIKLKQVMSQENQFIKNFQQYHYPPSQEKQIVSKASAKLKKIVLGDQLIIYRQITPPNETEDKNQQEEAHGLPTIFQKQRNLKKKSSIKCKTQQNQQETSTLPSKEQSEPNLLSRNAKQKQSNKYRHLKQKFDLIKEDIISHPVKYKIASESLGVNPQKIYALRQEEYSRLKEDYQRKKGIEYLGYSKNHAAKGLQRSKTEQNPLRSSSQTRSKTYVRQIFKDVAEVQNKYLQRMKQRERRKAQKQKECSKLQQKQYFLGRIVYNRVKKYMVTEDKSRDFLRRVNTEQKIDDALINFVKTKIKKAEAIMTKQ